MKRFCVLLLWCLLTAAGLFAQVNDLQLAQQYTMNGEAQKAFDIYQKLYKQDNENYYSYYVNSLIGLKKFDEAESITKKLQRKHPNDYQYTITLGRIYREEGNNSKADEVYDNLIKNLPPDQALISSLATGFYQAENTDYAIKIFLQGRKLLKNDRLYSLELISLYRFKRDNVALTNEYVNFLPENPGYLNQAENTLSTVYNDDKDYNYLKTELLKRIQKDPDATVYADLLTWQYLQQKQFGLALNQALALSRRIDDKGSSIYDLCRTLIGNGAYDEAIRGYEFIIEHSTKTDPFYIPSKIDILDAKNIKITSGKFTQADLTGLEQDYINLLNEFGRNASTAFAMQRLANLEAFKLHNLIKAKELLEEAINIQLIRPNLLAQCKLDLGDIYLMSNQPWDATLIYGQVEKANPGTAIGQEAQYRNAKLAYYTGDFNWAKGQLDVLKAATSQLIANDALNLSLLISDNITFDTTGAALKMYARADLLIFKQQPEKALLTLDSIAKKYPNNPLDDDIMMSKARIYIQQQDYQAAITSLKTIAELHSYSLWADDANFMLGDIYENKLNDKVQAKSYYQKIITNYPGSLWINEARKRFRILRGDQPDTSS
ncbi:tetratricopeptide repeat protein [Mucilaginibacter sp. KACC 22063]|uniref:tetratricopeptide repeat protein n=1 Tax=Mucilaginibacter sp. KACC 22063 TaxID=3025666 RepID=UPI0023671A6D|nr:tetratricopeptide repeat protein [Mucilaginibacter sp. KACC 22063]WDF54911.1 tetratricopeptide repeat protein [Mucilaginibacter sp. KACC 22063]